MDHIDLKRSESSMSTLSCITVENEALDTSLASSSTPPTSINDAGSTVSTVAAKDNELNASTGRARRSRQSVVNYNENVLANTSRTPIRRKQLKTPTKTESEETLVPKLNKETRQLIENSIQLLDIDWSVDALPGDTVKQPTTAKKPRTRLPIDKDTIAVASSALQKTASALGKRSRDAVGAGFGRLQGLGRRQSLRPRVQAVIEAREIEATPSKKIKLTEQKAEEIFDARSSSTRKSIAKPLSKKWLSQGLYVGQDPEFDPRYTNAKNEQLRAEKGGKVPEARRILPLPMFAGKRFIENGRPFRLPWEIFSPLPPGQPKPEEWRKTQKNVFVGEAGDIWKKTKKLEYSTCICTPETGCDETCFNRFMFYECDDTNCNVGPEHCKNRSFEDLRKRVKAGGKYNIGVEVIKTADRGYGVRSNRTFEPGQIILEYTGEIITQDECDERMRKRYKNNECFYLMIFDQNMIIDATRGSIARFVNHSCEPNCKMVKWTVAGKPRMALFAGDRGIMTGEELTYDYNFDPFSAKNIQKCLCGAPTCRGVLGPKPKERELKDASKPLTVSAGTKRKLQQAMGDVAGAVSSKKRKVTMPKSVKKAAASAKITAKAQLAKAASQKVAAVKKVSERSERHLKRARAKGKTTTVKFRSRTVKGGAPATIPPRTSSRGNTIRVDSKTVRRNVVRTIKGAQRRGGVGKSIRVIEAE